MSSDEELPDDLDDALEPKGTILREGFLVGAEIDPLPDDDDFDLPSYLERLLTHPRCRRLEELTLPHDDALGAVLDVLVAHGPATLRSLAIGKHFGHPSIDRDTYAEEGDAFDVGPLFGKLSRLERVKLRAGGLRLSTLNAPALRALTIETDPLPPEIARAVGGPSLEELVLWLGLGRDAPAAADFAPLFAATAAPRLRTLALKHTTISDDLVDALAGSPLAGQLETLDLSRGNLTPTGLARLTKGAFPRLRKLDVSANGLGESPPASLVSAFPEVVCRHAFHASWYKT